MAYLQYMDNEELKSIIGRKKRSKSVKTKYYNYENFHKNNSFKCKKKPWTQQEDDLLRNLIEENGPHNWTYMSTNLPGRIGKQCRERWYNHLSPHIKKTAWSKDEEWVLFLYNKAIGNKWAKIAKNIEGRTDNSIKNHWHSGMKSRIPELQQTLIQIQNQFKKEGESFLNQVTNEVERKVLDIILLNKRYEGLDDDYGSQDEIPKRTKRSQPLQMEEKLQKIRVMDQNQQKKILQSISRSCSPQKNNIESHEFSNDSNCSNSCASNLDECSQNQGEKMIFQEGTSQQASRKQSFETDSFLESPHLQKEMEIENKINNKEVQNIEIIDQTNKKPLNQNINFMNFDFTQSQNKKQLKISTMMEISPCPLKYESSEKMINLYSPDIIGQDININQQFFEKFIKQKEDLSNILPINLSYLYEEKLSNFIKKEEQQMF